MAEMKLFKGGEFLITEALPEEVFTPEDFTQDQRLIAKSAEEFGLKELEPRREELEELNPELVKALLKKAGDLGFLGADMPEIYGGSELDKVSSVLLTEHISQGVSAFFVAYGVQTGIGSLPIVFFGTPEQKKKYLPGLASGDIVGAYALTEPGHGSDALGAETTAVLSGDGKHYVLNGQKQFISNAGFADLFLTYAQIDGKQFTSFIVDRNWDGVSVDEEEKKMGVHGSSTRSVIFQDVKVPVENILGEVGRGHVVALNTLNIGRYKLGAGALGGCKLLIQEGVKYAKNRVQFGKPICEFGLIKHKIAEMVIRTYATESMVYRTAGLLDLALEGIDPSSEEAGKKTGEALRKYALECSINKVFGSEVLDYVADECVQIMGGYGYIQGNPVETAYRDSRINRIWEGTNEINRLLIVDMLMKSALKGELPLLDEIRKITGELISLRPDFGEDEGILEREKKMVSMAKKIALLAAGAAAQRYMERLAGEQEIVALIADMIISIFSMESSLLRTLKKIQKDGEENSRIHIAATRTYIEDTFPRLDIMARQIFAAISEGEELRTQLMALKKLARYAPINTISLRREIAESIIPVARYHLTKI
ncbi:MAG: acyl-CoA dehydrogenase family protein [Deltaproteobacteria bacterium]|nr:acyl-CoA dehydrogenase family protein [Deltaproteobacteria bacterium]MBW2137209.1 acyl-CoA dehydrogenase family protein [Deltaproteobacteria bacterium]